LKTAAFLRVVYEEPTEIEHSVGVKEELHAEDAESVTHGSKKRYGIHLNLHVGQ
jgi:hypothetical protein